MSSAKNGAKPMGISSRLSGSSVRGNAADYRQKQRGCPNILHERRNNTDGAETMGTIRRSVPFIL